MEWVGESEGKTVRKGVEEHGFACCPQKVSPPFLDAAPGLFLPFGNPRNGCMEYTKVFIVVRRALEQTMASTSDLDGA